MAEPRDSSINLEDSSAIIQTQYMPEFVEQYERMGGPEQRLFTVDDRIVKGDGETLQTELGAADSVRTSLDPLAAFPGVANLSSTTLRVRFNRQTSSSNDFVRLSASTQSDIYTIEGGDDGAIVDLAERNYRSIRDDYNEKMAVLRHTTRVGTLALVNGTPEANNGYYLGQSTGTATNALGGRVAVDGGSIAQFRRNIRVDFINPSTGAVNAGNIRITDKNVNPDDLSIGFEYVSSGPSGELSTGDLANIADNDLIVFSGTYNSGLWSIGAYFSAPTASETFIGGVDRTTAGYRWLIPVRIRDGASSTAITRTHFDDLANAMGLMTENDEVGYLFTMHLTLHSKLRNDIGNDAFIPWDSGNPAMKKYANFGTIGLNYQHPQFGVVKLTASALHPQTSVRALALKTWKTLFYQTKGLRPVMEGGRHWYRMNEETPNTGKGLIYKADWFCNVCDWCEKPWMNGAILSVAAA